MTRTDELAAAFEADRPRLVRVAYAVLGSHADAQDVVADTWLRLVDADTRDRVQDVQAWATVAVARRALDVLRSARVRRESYVGPWLPEPVIDDADPADRVTLDDSVSFALLVVLESLTPAERTSWVLHELFGMPFDEIATTVGRTPAAVRQLAARARRHVAEHRPRIAVDADEHSRAVSAFLRAAGGGDLAELMTTLDADVVCTSDGGGHVNAARRPVRGADRVGRFLLGVFAKARPGDELRPLSVNGLLGLGIYRSDALYGVVSIAVDSGRVNRIDFVLSPEKLPV